MIGAKRLNEWYSLISGIACSARKVIGHHRGANGNLDIIAVRIEFSMHDSN
jgi:hypothetical protein